MIRLQHNGRTAAPHRHDAVHDELQATAARLAAHLAPRSGAYHEIWLNGKSLAGAALNSFLKKCKREACEPKALSAGGKKLSGAAKNSFMRKCEKDA